MEAADGRSRRLHGGRHYGPVRRPEWQDSGTAGQPDSRTVGQPDATAGRDGGTGRGRMMAQMGLKAACEVRWQQPLRERRGRTCRLSQNVTLFSSAKRAHALAWDGWGAELCPVTNRRQ